MAKKLNELSGMPRMTFAFAGWKSQITLVKIETNVVNGFDDPIETAVSFKGTIQPLSAEDLELKPEAQRGFQWLQIHVEVDDNTQFLPLAVGDIILYNDLRYRVNGKKDYRLNNFIEYHALEVTQNE